MSRPLDGQCYCNSHRLSFWSIVNLVNQCWSMWRWVVAMDRCDGVSSLCFVAVFCRCVSSLCFVTVFRRCGSSLWVVAVDQRRSMWLRVTIDWWMNGVSLSVGRLMDELVGRCTRQTPGQITYTRQINRVYLSNPQLLMIAFLETKTKRFRRLMLLPPS